MSLFLDALVKETANLTDKDRDRLAKSMLATLSGTPKPTAPPPQTPYEHFVADIFRAYSEFFQAYENVMRMADLARLKFKQPNPVTTKSAKTLSRQATVVSRGIFKHLSSLLIDRSGQLRYPSNIQRS